MAESKPRLASYPIAIVISISLLAGIADFP